MLDGCASEVVELAKEAGVALTPGRRDLSATGSDPHDRNIRIAPTFPDLATVGRPPKASPSACCWPRRARCWRVAARRPSEASLPQRRGAVPVDQVDGYVKRRCRKPNAEEFPWTKVDGYTTAWLTATAVRGNRA